MALATGATLGRYVIIAPLGRGGMGEVYEAKDTKIGRKVAIKVLPERLHLDRERLRRFEKEAQATGTLNHPNILAVYDIGTHQDAPYIVTELLEGETLRDLLRRGALRFSQALEYATQIAHGLAAAHASGVIHRDLKPENLFVTKAGTIKILDFGLAKLPDLTGSSEAHTDALTIEPETNPRKIFGTAGYMSPEQVRCDGIKLDHRSDIFSFGVVLFEMVTGRRAFRAGSDVETMNAVLKENPLEQLPPEQALNPVAARIINHCLEKEPAKRFQSTRDLAFDLETVTALTSTNSAPLLLPVLERPRKSRRTALLALSIALLCVLLAVGSFFLGRKAGRIETPTYHQLTFRRGTVSSARFSVDGQTIFYNAAWNGSPVNIFSARVENPEPRALGMENADILAVSSTGEMAILMPRVYFRYFVNRGTLARIPLFGGTPREILENVQQADWSPDGTQLAVVRRVGGQTQLEFPIGKTLYSTAGYVSYPRVSPKGNFIAFFDHPTDRDNRGSVAVVDYDGRKTVLTGEWTNPQGLAWSPSGEEVWFTASKSGEPLRLNSVTLSMRENIILRAPQSLFIHDISRDGRVLLTAFNDLTTITGLLPGETKERDLSWLDRASLYDVSADGKTLLFQYYGEGSGKNYSTYLRKTDGTPAVKLGDGAALSLSPDGKWVLAVVNDPWHFILLPTGPGETRQLDFDGINDLGNYSWFQDGKRLVFVGRKEGQQPRCYVLSIEGGKPQALTPEGVTGKLLSPDGRLLIATDPNHKRHFFSLPDSKFLPIPGLEEGDEIIRWQADARALFVYRRGELPIKIYRVNLVNGRRELWRELVSSNESGILGGPRIFLSDDGKSYVYHLRRHLSNLYIVKGLMP